MSALTVNFNAAAAQATTNLTFTNNKLNKVLSQLSSGLQIQTAADNPAGYVTAGLLGDQAQGYGVAIVNAQNGGAVLQTAQSALNQTVSVIQQMQQLAYNSANSGSTDAAAQQANNQEYQALQTQLNEIANTTQFGSQQLLNGSYVGTFQINTGTNSYSQLNVTISTAVTASGLGLSTTSVGSASTATSAITALSAALSSVDQTAAYVGAQQNVLSDAVNALTVGQQNLQSAQSNIVDVNFAQASTQLAADQILVSSGSSMLANAQQEPQAVLHALGL